jgi:hypothetical protein
MYFRADAGFARSLAASALSDPGAISGVSAAQYGPLKPATFRNSTERVVRSRRIK